MAGDKIEPRKAWTLSPSFKPVEVTLVKSYDPWGGGISGHYTDSGKWVQLKDEHPTKEAAIAAGYAQIEKMRADIAKRTATLEKRIAALDKASVT